MDRKFLNTFWNEKVVWKNIGDVTEEGAKTVRCNGSHYVIGTEGFTDGPYLGLGGRKIRITFTDGPHKGQVVDTNNLWCQSEIDQEFKELLPDNAEIDWMYHWNKTLEERKAN